MPLVPSRASTQPRADVVATYRYGDAECLWRLLRHVPATWDVRAWALDRPHPSLVQVTVGSGPTEGCDPLQRLLVSTELTEHRWLVVVQRPVALRGGLAGLVSTAAAANLDLVMPAHRRVSRHRFVLPRHRVGAIARRTSYVEWSPVSAVAPDWRARVLDVVDSHPRITVDIELSRLAADGLRLGVVDRTPMLALDWPPEPSADAFAELERRLESYHVVSPTLLQRVDAVQWCAGTWWFGSSQPPWSRHRRTIVQP